MEFGITFDAIDVMQLRAALQHNAAGAMVCFEGWVRDHAEGRAVSGLEYEVYPALAIREGNRILAEARARFPLLEIACVHRVGSLDIGDCAVFVGVSSAHRAAAFDGCRYIIDELKVRVPVWKKETFSAGDAHWVNCQACAAHAPASAAAD